MPQNTSSPATLKAAVYGAAVGDALGVPYEFQNRGSFQCTGMTGDGFHHQPAGTFSDDTSMILATCDSLKATGGRIDVTDIRHRFSTWCYQGNYTPDGMAFGIGNTTLRALDEGVGGKGEFDNGNGSLMRIIPLAFTDASDKEVREVSSITHAHRFSTDACVIYIHIARNLIAGASIANALASNVALEAEEGAWDEVITDVNPFMRLQEVANLPEDSIESDGYVVHTLEAALWCLSRTDTYANCVLKAVNLGSDTDTTACVAGALAGIVYGFDAIPTEWVKTLRAKETIDACLFA